MDATGSPQVGETLTAGPGTIEDGNGLPAFPSEPVFQPGGPLAKVRSPGVQLFDTALPAFRSVVHAGTSGPDVPRSLASISASAAFRNSGSSTSSCTGSGFG